MSRDEIEKVLKRERKSRQWIGDLPIVWAIHHNCRRKAEGEGEVGL